MVEHLEGTHSMEETSMERRRAEKKRRQKKKRRVQTLIRIIAWSIMLGIVLVVGYRYDQRMRDLSGVWVREIELTDEVIYSITDWLSDVSGVQTDAVWVGEQTDKLSVQVVFQARQTGKLQGEYQVTIDKTSYEDLQEQSVTLLASCMEQIIAKKLEQAGYEDQVTAEDADAIIQEILGCSMEAYLKEMGIRFVPSLEELAAEVEEQGSYSMNRGEITWDSTLGQIKEAYVKQKDYLIFPEKDLIYKKVEEGKDE